MTDLPNDFPKQFEPELIDLASQSPCSRAKRGALVVKSLMLSNDGHTRSWQAAGGGWNAPVTGGCSDALCQQQELSWVGAEKPLARVRSCSSVVEHAEAAAIRDTLDDGQDVRGGELIHLNTQMVDGERVPKVSRQPRCGPCAVQAKAYGIAGVWLLHTDGWKRYPIEEFYQRSVGLWTS